MSSQLAMAASTMTASHIMMGMGITSCTQHIVAHKIERPVLSLAGMQIMWRVRAGHCKLRRQTEVSASEHDLVMLDAAKHLLSLHCLGLCSGEN